MSQGKARRISKDKLTQNDIKTFESAIEKQGISDCIVLKPIEGKCGSTFFKCDDGTTVTPKRLAYAIAFGECKEGFALYSNGKCHNSLCINPRHYKLVDQGRGYNYSNDTKQNDKVDNDKFKYEPLSAPNVKDFIAKQHDRLDEKIGWFTDGCESPIEELFAIAIRPWLRSTHDKFERQKEFTFGETTYRVDFCITRTFRAPYTDINMQRTVVVECDGFGYHYATQEQVERDHERDRAFMMHGITVMRFTGSEINKDPDGCASAVLNMLLEKERDAEFDILHCIEAYKEDTNEVHD